MYHLSNIFFRDVQYGILKMFERRGEKVSYPLAERIAKEFVEKLEKEKVLSRIDQQSWVLHYPEYKKPVVAPAPAAKPAPGAAPAKSPAVAGAKPALPPLGGAKPAAPASVRPALPPLGSAKPADGTKPALPPLSNAKPVGGAKPALPPLASAKPVGGVKPSPMQPASANPSANANAPQTKSEQRPDETAVEKPKAETTGGAQQGVAAAPTPGQKKSLPPLKGSYTPAGKK